jgi:hypothetical protein
MGRTWLNWIWSFLIEFEEGDLSDDTEGLGEVW